MLAQLRERFADWLAYRNTVEALNLLDCRTLEDVGVAPGKAEAWARAKLAEQRVVPPALPLNRRGSPARIWSHRPVPNR
jgi:uncharacterized protein YjiS (DUF1127 family)